MWQVLLNKTPKMVTPDKALAGRDVAVHPGRLHAVFNTPLAQYDHHESNARCLILGMGCFWGAERLFWRQILASCEQKGPAS